VLVLTARQMFWAGLTLVVVWIGSGALARVLYEVALWAAPGPFTIGVGSLSALGAVGAALLAGALVVTVVERHRGPAGVPMPAAGDNPRPPSG
jgi:hypothetical protein